MKLLYLNLFIPKFKADLLKSEIQCDNQNKQAGSIRDHYKYYDIILTLENKSIIKL